jgi:membrane-anchored mycosin MYCP
MVARRFHCVRRRLAHPASTTYKAVAAGHHSGLNRSSIAYVMVSSMASRRPPVRFPVPGLSTLPRLGAILIFATFAAAPAPAAAAVVSASAAAPVCQTQPEAGRVEAAIPWPQARYDFDAVGRISVGAGVVVAVIDSGVAPNTPQLNGSVLPGGDLLDPSGDGRIDCVGHGTAVASIIAAQPTAGSGLRGLAPAAKVLAVRVSERIETEQGIVGAGDVKALAAGIRGAVGGNPRPSVINLSISTTTDHPELRAAIQAALDADIVVVAAAGNQHRPALPNGQADPRPDPVTYPAAYPGVIGVGGITPAGQRVDSSQVGSYVDIVAPGDSVTVATPGGGHLTYQGTSFATPFVAATVALIRSHWPLLDREGVVHRLLATADPASGGDRSRDYGHGVVNPLRALTAVLAPAPSAVAVSPTPLVTPGFAARAGTPPPTTLAITAAAILLVGSAAILGLASAMPAGRRRRWRPGRIEDALTPTNPNTMATPTPTPTPTAATAAQPDR